VVAAAAGIGRLTQEELAERAGLATRTLSNLESGRIRRPHSRSLHKLASALGLSARAGDELQARFRADVSDGTVHPGSGDSLTAVPRQLPSTVPSFVGRSAEFAQLDRWLAEARRDAGGAAIFGIGGMAGVGKTALALCWTAEALGGILVALGASAERVPATLEDRSELYRRLAAGRRLLIVIDNAKDASQVRALALARSAAWS
jgi:transcriptional regulator with XRE-family HTH domain